MEAGIGAPATEAARRNTRARFEQWARNPSCQANTISAVHNVRMADVAKADGVKYSYGQSPFAIARGQTFERGLLWDSGKVIREALIDAAVLPAGSAGFADHRISMNGGPIPTLDLAIDATVELLRRVADDSAGAPAVVAGATMSIPKGVMLPEAILILDVLAIRTDTPFPELVVGEVKTYPDRGGFTDSADLAAARAQAGLYIHALELLLDQNHLTERVVVRRDGFLVLTRPGSNRPSIRSGEDLKFQAERARRGFELLELAAQGLPPFSPIGEDPVIAVQRASTEYSEACLGFCERASKCHEEALAAANPAVLGDDVRRFLGAVDLNRAMELLDGADPANDAETDLMRRISETDWMASR